MTDRLKGCIVVFDRDIRDDDAEGLLHAIEHLRGVVSVSGSVTDTNDYFARERIRHELVAKLYDALKTP